ncbi:zona pellucida sperm-binding protein 1-like [Melospiza melodia melodia]|uniref:zona pellucida sperm-binding protein 1-like n=1 Tax=Melospiza melodia melodia TaxID=1914991 RepID=UPI002FD5FF40
MAESSSSINPLGTGRARARGPQGPRRERPLRGAGSPQGQRVSPPARAVFVCRPCGQADPERGTQGGTDLAQGPAPPPAVPSPRLQGQSGRSGPARLRCSPWQRPRPRLRDRPSAPRDGARGSSGGGSGLLGTGLGPPRDGARGFSWTGPRLLGTGPRLSRTGPAAPLRPDPAGTPSGSPQTSRHSPRPERFPGTPGHPLRCPSPGASPGPAAGTVPRARWEKGTERSKAGDSGRPCPPPRPSCRPPRPAPKLTSELASSHGPGPGVALHVRRSPDACLPNPCQHQGQCQVPVDRPVCSCKPGFTGEFCQDVVLKLACEEEHMKMMVRKEVFELLKIPLELVHLKNQACKVSEKEEEGELFFAAVLTGENHTACGSVIQQNSSHVSYSNAIESEQEAPRAPISRSFQLEVHFSCIYAYQQVVRLPFALTAVDKLVQLVVREGHFNVSMRLYKSPSYLEPYHLPSVAVPLTDTLYVLLKMEGQHQLKYFLLSVLDCWATPSPDPHQDTQHKLIEQGCPHDETVTYLNAIGESTSAKFSFQMFQFVGYPEMFLHCRVQLCVPDSPEPCAKQCPRHGRSRRALADDHNRIVSYGPILLLAAPPSGADIHRSSSDQQDPAGASPWLSRALILLGVLTVLAVAAVAVSVRRRMG